MDGATGFEPATACAPCKCANRLGRAPTVGLQFTGKRRSTAQQLEDVLELGADLTDDLLALRMIRARFFARQLLARAADREAFLVEQAADLTDDQHVLPLIVAAITAALDRFELDRKSVVEGESV